MKSLITGASGFAGRALQAHLADVGDEVVGWSRSNGDPDITDRSQVFEAIATALPDVVYHLAAQSHVPTAWADPMNTLSVNVGGTQNVLDAAIAANQPRVIVVTSAEVYGSVGPQQLPITEDFPLRPSNPYAASKVGADAVALGAYLGSGLEVIRMRAFNHFGPGQSTNFVSAALARRIATAAKLGEASIEVGSLDVQRDFTDVADVARAYRLAATHGIPGEVYNVCSDVSRPIRQLAEAFVIRSGASIDFAANASLVRAVDSPIVRGSSERLRDQTGWRPEISFEDSLDAIYRDAVTNIEENNDL